MDLLLGLDKELEFEFFAIKSSNCWLICVPNDVSEVSSASVLENESELVFLDTFLNGLRLFLGSFLVLFTMEIDSSLVTHFLSIKLGDGFMATLFLSILGDLSRLIGIFFGNGGLEVA